MRESSRRPFGLGPKKPVYGVTVLGNRTTIPCALCLVAELFGRQRNHE